MPALTPFADPPSIVAPDHPGPSCGGTMHRYVHSILCAAALLLQSPPVSAGSFTNRVTVTVY
jgi:hypothetical protein